MSESKVDIATLLEKGSFSTHRNARSRSPKPYPPRQSSNSPPMYSSPSPSPPSHYGDSTTSQSTYNTQYLSYSNDCDSYQRDCRGRYPTQPATHDPLSPHVHASAACGDSMRDPTYSHDYDHPKNSSSDHRIPIERSARPKAYTVSYNTVRKPTVPPPPPPSCEDEEVSLAREHCPQKSKDEYHGIVRGDPEQHPVMIENEDYVPEYAPEVIADHIKPKTDTTPLGDRRSSPLRYSNGFVLVSDPTASRFEVHHKTAADVRRERVREQRPREGPSPPSNRVPVKERDSRYRDRDLPSIPSMQSAQQPRTPPSPVRERERGRDTTYASSNLRGQRSRLDLRNRADSEARSPAQSSTSYAYSPHSYTSVNPSVTASSVKDGNYTYSQRDDRRSPSANVGASARVYRDEQKSASSNPGYESPSSSAPRLFGPKPEPTRSSNERLPEIPKHKTEYSYTPDLRPHVPSGTGPERNRGSPERRNTRDYDEDPISRPKSSSGRRRASIVIQDEMPRVPGPRSSEPHVRMASRGPGSLVGLASSPMSATHSARDLPGEMRSSAPYPEDDDLPEVLSRVNNLQLSGGTRPTSRGTRPKHSSPGPYASSMVLGPAGPRNLQQQYVSSARRSEASLPLDHGSPKSLMRLPEIFPPNPSVGAYRRYLEDPEKYHQRPLPQCHFSAGSDDIRPVTFMTLPDVPDFDICIPCYKEVFANGPYRNQFIESNKPFRAGKKIRCDFGTTAWYQIGWIMALKRREPSISEIYMKITNIMAHQSWSCSTRKEPLYMFTLRYQWAPTNINLLPDFAVCPRCMECIYHLLPNIYTGQLCMEVKPAPGQRCAFSVTQTERFINMFDCLEVCSDRGMMYNRPPDGPKLVEELGQIIPFARCTGPTAPRSDQLWYVIEQLENLTFCGDCYYTCVKPIRHTDGGKRLAPIEQRKPLATCELHSDRMKRMLQVASQTLDLSSMRNDIWVQRRANAEIVAQMMDGQGRRF